MTGNRYAMNAQFQTWRRRPTFSAAANMYFGAWVGQVVLTLAARALARHFPALSGEGTAMTVTVLFQTAFLMLPVLRYCASRPGMAQGLRVKSCAAIQFVLSGLAAITGLFFADNLGTLWLVLLETLGAEISSPGMTAAPMAIQLLTGALVPALCEEMMFRGVMLSTFERQNKKKAVLVSAALFALLHGSVSGLPVHFALGLALGYIALNADSIYPAVLFHLVYNGLAIALGIADGSQQPLYAQIGGLHGLTGCLIRTALYGAVMCGLIVCLRGTRKVPEAEKSEEQEMSADCMIVMAAGIVTAVCAYVVDAMTMWGVL